MEKRIAQCSCGQLKAVCEGEPTFVSLCHCKLCQKRTGSVFGVNAAFPIDKVEVSGKEKSYSRRGDSGRQVTFHFCVECGTSVYWEGEMRPDMRLVAVGAFTDPHFAPPVREVWAENRYDWVKEPSEVPVFPKGAGHGAASPAKS